MPRNALLKTLEEPRAGVTLILVTSRALAAARDHPEPLSEACAYRRRRATPASPGSSAARAQGPWARGARCASARRRSRPAQPIRPRWPAWPPRPRSAAGAACPGGWTMPSALAERWARGEQFELRLTCIETWLTSRIDRRCRGRRPIAGNAQWRALARIRFGHEYCSVAAAAGWVYELRAFRLTSINRAVALEQLLWQLARMRAGAACRELSPS